MKIIDKIKILSATILLLCACSGEDRTHEYLALTQHNNWVFDMMKENYLWADTIQTPDERKFFGDPSTFLKNITSKVKEDKWSYLTVDTIVSDPFERGYFNHNESYGMDYMLVTDPTGQTTKQYVRILTVYKGSAAERAGLQRGDFIMSFNGYKFSSSNITKLKKGIGLNLKVCHLDADTEDNTYYWKDTVDYVLGQSSVPVDEVPKPVNTIDLGVARVGYMCCTKIDSKSLSWAENLIGYDCDELVLDLRLCNYGGLEDVQKLASSIVAKEYADGVFANVCWNKFKASQNNSTLRYVSMPTLGLHRIFVLTSGYTRGAAEWLIHSLLATLGEDNVILIGETTAGQNVLNGVIRSDEYMITLYPAVAFISDANDNYDYASGITPTYEIREREYLHLYPYGNPQEVLLNKALEIISESL